MAFGTSFGSYSSPHIDEIRDLHDEIDRLRNENKKLWLLLNELERAAGAHCDCTDDSEREWLDDARYRAREKLSE